jgi:hypothetical protein
LVAGGNSVDTSCLLDRFTIICIWGYPVTLLYLFFTTIITIIIFFFLQENGKWLLGHMKNKAHFPTMCFQDLIERERKRERVRERERNREMEKRR